MIYHHDGAAARRVDTEDPDRLHDLAAWCRGKVVDDGEYVLTMPIPVRGEALRVKAGHWIVRDRGGVFYVHREPHWRPIIDPWPWFLVRAAS